MNLTDMGLGGLTIPLVPTAMDLLTISKATSTIGNGASDAVTSLLNNDVNTFSQVATPFTDTSTTTPALNANTNAFNSPGTNNPLSLGTPVSTAPSVLAMPSFVTGAKDSLAAVDVYKVKPTTLVNSITNLPTKLNLDTLTGLVGGGNGLAALNTAINATAKNMADLNKVNPLVRIAGASTAVSGALKTLPPGCSNGLLNKILKDINKGSKIKANMGGLFSRLKKANLPCVTGMGGLVNNLSGIPGSFSILDPAASIASLSGVVKSATDIGIPNVFGSVMAQVTDKATINQVAGSVLPDITAASDIGSLSSMATMTTSGSLMLSNPDVIGDFSRGYMAPIGASTDSIANDYTSVKSTYDLVDPTWNTCARGTESITDLSSVTGTGPDFNKLIISGVVDGGDIANQNLLLAPVFPPTDVSSEITKQFPSVALSTNSNIPTPSSVVVDPITLNNQITTASPIVQTIMTPSTIFAVPDRKDIHADGSYTITIDTSIIGGPTRTAIKNYDSSGERIA
jgi:hypothetical protein